MIRLPAANWFRTLSPVQLLKLLNPVTSLLSYMLSSLAHNNWTHRIQTPFTHLQSPHDHPISISPQPHLCSTSQHSLFISGYPRSTTNIILATYNWSLLAVHLNSTQLNEHLWTQVLKHLNVHIYLVTVAHAGKTYRQDIGLHLSSTATATTGTALRRPVRV